MHEDTNLRRILKFFFPVS